MEVNRLIKNDQSELNLPKDNAYILSSKNSVSSKLHQKTWFQKK
jgi:hypothetical protein